MENRARWRIALGATMAAGLIGVALAQPPPRSQPSRPSQPSQPPPSSQQQPSTSMTAKHPTAMNTADMKFAGFPALPTCMKGAVVDGDPTQSASMIMAKLDAGCTIPWHWHTPTEHVMIVTGTARVQMKDGQPTTIRAGGYAMMPSHHIHHFACQTACTFFLYSDAKFDIHYVDPQGNEIAPEEALKPLKETVTAMR